MNCSECSGEVKPYRAAGDGFYWKNGGVDTISLIEKALERYDFPFYNFFLMNYG